MPPASTIAIETIARNPSALIVGNPQQLGVLLATALSHRHLASTLFFPTTSPATQLHLPPDVTRIADLSQTFPYPSYCCLIPEPHQNFEYFSSVFAVLSHLQAENPPPKILLLVDSTWEFSENLPQHFQKKFPQLSLHLLRTLHYFHLFGPGVSLDSYHHLNWLITAPSDILTADIQTSTLYPFFNQDLPEVACKLLFTTSSKSDYYLAGNPTTLINFHLHARSFSPPKFPPSVDLTSLNLPPQHLVAINTSTADIPAHSTTPITAALEDTVTWIKAQPSPVYQPPPLLQEKKRVVRNPITPPTEPNLPEVALTPLLESPEPPLSPPLPNPTPSPTIPPKTILPPPSTSTSPRLLQTSKPVSRRKKKSKYFLLTLLIFCFIFLISFPFLNLYFLTRTVKQLQTDISSTNFQTLDTTTDRLDLHLSLLESQLTFVSPLAAPLFPRHLKTARQLTQLLSTSAAISHQTAKAFTTGSQTLQAISGSSSDNLPLLLTTSRTDLTSLYHSVSELEADLTSHPELKTIESFGIGESITQLDREVKRAKPLLHQTIQMLSHSDSLLGFDRQKTYLVLLQNSAELRPTGGFLGSFALVSFESGHLVDVVVHDVYTADGQLQGHVEPPSAIKEHLGEAGWYLRDVNWDPHFPTTAKRAAWFLDKEMSLQVDGVVGLNLYVIQSLLEATGPITLPDYSETITADNLFERVEHQVEMNQFPGSTQKQDILGSLTRQLLDTFINAPTTNTLFAAHSFIQSLNTSQTQLYFQDYELQSLVGELGWSGELPPVTCSLSVKSQQCLPDFLAVVEANVGVNKSNYFVTRKHSHQVTVNDNNTLDHLFTLTLHNSSPSETWPGGTYKNYVRFYTPLDSHLLSLRLNSQPITLTDVDLTTEHSKQVFGLLLLTPPGETTTLDLTYRLSTPFPLTSPAAYSLILVKQPGTGNDPLSFSLDFPDQYSLIRTDPATNLAQPNSFSTTFDKNHTLTFELAK